MHTHPFYLSLEDALLQHDASHLLLSFTVRVGMLNVSLRFLRVDYLVLSRWHFFVEAVGSLRSGTSLEELGNWGGGAGLEDL